MGFIYIILNLFFSEQITRSSLKDLKYTAHVAKINLAEEQGRMKDSLALHVTSPEFGDFLSQKKFVEASRLIENWKSLLKIDAIQYYDTAGVLVDFLTGLVSEDNVILPKSTLKRLGTGYGQTHYRATKDGLIVSVKRKIVDKNYSHLGFLVERKKIPYKKLLENSDSEDLVVSTNDGVVYTTAGISAAKKLSQKFFSKGAFIFELTLSEKFFDIFRLDIVPGVTFFLAKENLREAVFRRFYQKYLLYFGLYLFFLILLFYLSYQTQVFKPLKKISNFIIESDKAELPTETSVYEISLIAKKLEEKISSLSDDVEKNKKDRVEDMSRLVASVAHELNNSLSYLGGNLDYLKEELEGEDKIDKEEFTEAISSAQSGYIRIKKIVSDLRVFSSKRDLVINWHPLVDLEKQITDEFKNIDINFSEEISDYEVQIDLDRTFQIIKNLIINAEQAYDLNIQKQILVSFYLNADELIISVRDWAGGIPKKSVSKIFEPFYTTKKNTGGAGLGLALSRSLAQEMGAGLILRETDSEGATFCFKIKHFRLVG